MGLRINTNVQALIGQNRLAQTTKKLEGTLLRLSTGLRINKGQDDPVGLLKSESLRSTLRGIGATELNISNGSSMLNIGEGTLAQVTDIAQKLKEYVTSAIDASVSSSDRANIRTAVSDLMNEYSRLIGASEFDGIKLLDGTFSAKTLQVGPAVTDAITFSIADTRSTAVGKVAVFTATARTYNYTTSGGATATYALDLTDVTSISITGTNTTSVSVGPSDLSADGVSNADSDESALAYVNAINAKSGQTGVSAIVLTNTYTGGVTYTDSTNWAMTASDTLYVNGVAIAQAAYANSTAGATSFVAAINNITTQTGVTATIDSSTSKISLSASDGRNIDIRFNGGSGMTAATNPSLMNAVMGINIGLINSALTAGGTAAAAQSNAVVFRGTFKMYADVAFSLTDAAGTINGGTTTATSVALNSATTLNNLSVTTVANAQEGVFIMNNVIRQIQTTRAQIGSKATRLEIAGLELSTRKENLSAAESVIRNADVATETASLTQLQILQQAGVTVLQRAQALPQLALSLLQGG